MVKRIGNNAIKCQNMQGAIKNTRSRIRAKTIQIDLDDGTAWALCNVLSKKHIENECCECLELDQKAGLISLGSAIGAFIDHNNKNFKHLNQ